MKSSDAIEIVKNELQEVLAERQQADRARQQALALVAKQDAKIAECDAAAARLNRVLAKLGGNASDATIVRTQGFPHGSRGRLTVRAVAERFFTENPRFIWEDLLDAVTRQIPDANISTIRAELSRAKTKGTIRRLEDHSWVSPQASWRQSDWELDGLEMPDEPDPAEQEPSAADWRAWEEMNRSSEEQDVAAKPSVPMVRRR